MTLSLTLPGYLGHVEPLAAESLDPQPSVTPSAAADPVNAKSAATLTESEDRARSGLLSHADDDSETIPGG